MCRYLFIYKGEFSRDVAGVGVRYISVAKELAASGHAVCIAGRSVPADFGGVRFIRAGDFLALLNEMKKADRVVLHGGGPFILSVLSLLSSQRRKVLLDAFAPHWLELHTAAKSRENIRPYERIAIKSKIIFNYFRLVWARLFFHGISVGTERQLDLVRGIVSQTGDIEFDRGLFIVTGGCDVIELPPRDSGGGLVKTFGWLGGLWDWFDETPVIEAVLSLARQGRPVEMNFYGVSPAKRQKIEKYVGKERLSLFRFNPWVPYAERFNEWRRISVAIVWAERTVENDYASRTRNFDCVTLGIPVIQNCDSFWSRILSESSAGQVIDSSDQLGDAMTRYMEDDGLYKAHCQNMGRLRERFAWSRIAREYEAAFAGYAAGNNKLVSLILLPSLLLQQILVLCLRRLRS